MASNSRFVLAVVPVVGLACSSPWPWQRDVELTPFQLIDAALPAPAGVTEVEVGGCRWSTGAGPGTLRPADGSGVCPGVLEIQAGQLQGKAPGLDRPVLFFVRRYGTDPNEPWAEVRFENGRAVITAPSPLGRLACWVDGRWRLMPDPPDLQRAETCVAEAGGAVLYVSGLVRTHQILSVNVYAITSIASFLALVLSLLLLCRFQKDVVRTLESGGAGPKPASPGGAPSAGPGPALVTLQAPAPVERFQRARRQVRAQIGWWVGAVVASANCLVAAMLIPAHPGPRSWLLELMAHLWPLGPMLAVLLRVRLWKVILGCGATFAVVCLLTWDAVNATVALGFNLVQTFLLVPLLVRRVRSAAPWVFLGLSVALAAGLGMLFLLFEPSVQQVVTKPAEALGVGNAPVVVSTTLAIAVVLGALAFWRLAPRFVRLSAALRLNDRILTLGSFWLSYCAVDIAGLINSSHGSTERWTELGFAAASVLPVIAALVMGLRRAPADERRVLYLRSFKSAQGTDLFERLQDLLLNTCGIDLIAGPDLATALARPQELLEFVGRSGGRKYLHDLRGFEARRAALDRRLDAEGRHRVHEYYCGNEIWRDVFRRLAADASAVLIDVRGLQGPESGVATELQELVRWVPLERVIVVTDGSRPAGLLEFLTGSAWRSLPAGSPNAGTERPAISVFEVASGRRSEVERLMGHICATAVQ